MGPGYSLILINLGFEKVYTQSSAIHHPWSILIDQLFGEICLASMNIFDNQSDSLCVSRRPTPMPMPMVRVDSWSDKPGINSTRFWIDESEYPFSKCDHGAGQSGPFDWRCFLFVGGRSWAPAFSCNPFHWYLILFMCRILYHWRDGQSLLVYHKLSNIKWNIWFFGDPDGNPLSLSNLGSLIDVLL